MQNGLYQRLAYCPFIKFDVINEWYCMPKGTAKDHSDILDMHNYFCWVTGIVQCTEKIEYFIQQKEIMLSSFFVHDSHGLHTNCTLVYCR